MASKKRGAAVNAMDIAEELLKKHNITILCETDNYLGLIKPSGMVCLHANKTTKGKSIDVSLEDAISRLAIPLSTVNMEMGKGGGSVGGRGIVHRLDRGTSGCILLAKTDEARLRFVCEFFVQGVEKQYRALIPRVLKENEGELVSQVEGKPARSKYCVEEVYGENTASLIRIKTFTGRKHQVQVQCAKELGSLCFWIHHIASDIITQKTPLLKRVLRKLLRHHLTFQNRYNAWQRLKSIKKKYFCMRPLWTWNGVVFTWKHHFQNGGQRQ